jgi:hypothetical protein
MKKITRWVKALTELIRGLNGLARQILILLGFLGLIRTIL